MFLAPDDIQKLTGKVQFAAQRRALARLGMRFGVRNDGSPIVLRTAVEAKYGARRTRETEAPIPNLKALEAVS